jgi:hypothetical protein
MRSITASGPEFLPRRIAVSGWCLLGLIAPQPVLRKLVTWRFT